MIFDSYNYDLYSLRNFKQGYSETYNWDYPIYISAPSGADGFAYVTYAEDFSDLLSLSAYGRTDVNFVDQISLDAYSSYAEDFQDAVSLKVYAQTNANFTDQMSLDVYRLSNTDMADQLSLAVYQLASSSFTDQISLGIYQATQALFIDDISLSVYKNFNSDFTDQLSLSALAGSSIKFGDSLDLKIYTASQVLFKDIINTPIYTTSTITFVDQLSIAALTQYYQSVIDQIAMSVYAGTQVGFIDQISLAAVEKYIGYALNLETGALSKLEGFKIDTVSGRFCCDKNGIYTFDGTLNIAAQIPAFIETGELNLKSNALKTASYAYLIQENGPTLLTVTADNEAIDYDIDASDQQFDVSKAKLADGVSDVYWKFKLANVKGSSGRVSDLRIMVSDKQRKF